MSYPFILQGDAESACVDILINHTPELAAYPGATPRVSTDMRGYVSPARWISVIQYGASDAWPKVDKPRIDFEVITEDSRSAYDFCRIIQASMVRAIGYRGNGLFLSDVTVEMGINRIPDKLTENPRYILSLRLTITPSD